MVTCFLHDIVRIQSNTIKNKEKYGAYVLELFLYLYTISQYIKHRIWASFKNLLRIYT